MNYIGSKYSLRDFIDNTIKKVVGDNPSDMVFCDLFAGTCIVCLLYTSDAADE